MAKKGFVNLDGANLKEEASLDFSVSTSKGSKLTMRADNEASRREWCSAIQRQILWLEENKRITIFHDDATFATLRPTEENEMAQVITEEMAQNEKNEGLVINETDDNKRVLLDTASLIPAEVSVRKAVDVRNDETLVGNSSSIAVPAYADTYILRSEKKSELSPPAVTIKPIENNRANHESDKLPAGTGIEMADFLIYFYFSIIFICFYMFLLYIRIGS